MGWDICAWVEVRPTGAAPGARWEALERVGYLNRSYDAFGCLFGFTNDLKFPPLVPQRGLPPDVSTRVAEEAARYQQADPAGYEHPTWASWAELAAMDWETEAARPAARIYHFGIPPDRMITDPVQLGLPATARLETGPDDLPGMVTVRFTQQRRRDVLGSDWEVLFGRLAQLAETQGADGVRLVVWFYF
jgi:hypothetical protein